MVTFKKLLLCLAIFCATTPSLIASEIYQSLVSYRALAMGNTGVASANDAYSLSYNPAVLANVESWWLDVGAWTVEASDGLQPLDVASNIVDIQYPYISETGLSDSYRTDFLSQTSPHIRANAGINFAARITGSGLAIGGNYAREVTIQGQDDNSVIFQRNERITQYGMSVPLGSGQWVLGVGRKKIERKDATSDADSTPVFGAYETGSVYDVGLLFRFAGASRSTLGIVMQNVGGLTLNGVDDVEPQEVHVGYSMNLEMGPVRVVPALDIRGVQTTREKTNRVHAGLEFGLFPNDTGGNLLTARVGSNQGYATQGAELNFFNRSILIGYTRYYEEIGTSAIKEQSSRRDLAYLSVGW
ncbi:MAG: hypothetical protein QNL04_15440 [SAR324 cluster bacterium]|nr:hypothetical protein [SAR324 cluster bacterium]